VIGQYELPLAKIQSKDFGIKLRVKLNNSGLAFLEDYIIEETKFEEIKEEPKKTTDKTTDKKEETSQVE